MGQRLSLDAGGPTRLSNMLLVHMYACDGCFHSTLGVTMLHIGMCRYTTESLCASSDARLMEYIACRIKTGNSRSLPAACKFGTCHMSAQSIERLTLPVAHFLCVALCGRNSSVEAGPTCSPPLPGILCIGCTGGRGRTAGTC